MSIDYEDKYRKARTRLARLQAAVEGWVRAEHAFRFGKLSFTADSQDWYVEAEANLRKVLTGENDLIEAARVLGVKVTEPKKKGRHHDDSADAEQRGEALPGEGSGDRARHHEEPRPRTPAPGRKDEGRRGQEGPEEDGDDRPSLGLFK